VSRQKQESVRPTSSDSGMSAYRRLDGGGLHVYEVDDGYEGEGCAYLERKVTTHGLVKRQMDQGVDR
jgi:hypothetical protein